MALLFVLVFLLLFGCCALLLALWRWLSLTQRLDQLSARCWRLMPSACQSLLRIIFDIEGRHPHIHRVINGWALLLATSAVVSITARSYWFIALTGLLLLYQVSRLQRTFASKQQRIKHELPDFCDLLSMMIAAGIPLIPAMAKVSTACDGGLLAKEIQRVQHHLRQGVTFEEALQRLAGFYRLPILNEWTTLLVQGHQQGSSLVTTLRFHSLQLRQQLLNEAEKKAQEAPVKLLFPLMTCFFPVNFLVILGPIVLQLAEGGL